MEWHYTLDGQTVGPVSEDELETLRHTGVIKNDTLVWRDGWKTWHPLSEVVKTPVRVAPAVSIPPLPAGGDSAHCAECQQVFAKSEMVSFEESYVCAGCKPVFFQKMREGIAPGSATAIWRSGRQLVTSVNATLPARCVKCNAPSDGRPLKRKLSWHHPALYLTIFAGLLIYVIIAFAVRNNATVLAGLCESHRARRNRAILISWLLVIAGIAAFSFGVSKEWGWWMAAGGASFFGGMIYAIIGTRVLAAKRIDKQNAWLAGCCPEFLATFPEWAGLR